MAVSSFFKCFIIFDGTGPTDQVAYDFEFRNSFCSQIKSWMKDEAVRFRGVTGSEKEIWGTVKGIIDNQVAQYAQRGLSEYKKIFSDRGKIFLVGHSRGGASALLFANFIKQNFPDMKIEAMFLFDAVKMHLNATAPVNKIRANVKVCYHAMRSPAFARSFNPTRQRIRKNLSAEIDRERHIEERMWGLDPFGNGLHQLSAPSLFAPAARQLAHQLGDIDDQIHKTRSDNESLAYNWGNTGTSVESDETELITREFMCSHSAVGGVPWGRDVFPNDAAESENVRNWMWSKIMYQLDDLQRVFDRAVQTTNTA